MAKRNSHLSPKRSVSAERFRKTVQVVAVTLKLKRDRRRIFKKTRIRALIVWYLLLLGGIIVLVWKMPAIVSHL